MLILQADMQREFRASINHLHERIDHLEERTEQIEQHLSTATTAHNTVVDIQDEHSEAIQQLHLKIANLENPSRWNNIEIRWVPEAITTTEITYLHQLFHKILQSITTQDMLIDQAHGIHKLQYLPASLPRDILACVIFFTG